MSHAAQVSSIDLARDLSGDEPGPWIPKDLKVTTSGVSGLGDFPAWYASTFSDRVPQTDEREGQLELTKPGFRTALLTVNLHGLGLYRRDTAAPVGDGIFRQTWSMYLESIDLRFPAQAPA